MSAVFQKYRMALEQANPIKAFGSVQNVIGMSIESRGPVGVVGDLCEIMVRDQKLLCEIIGFRSEMTLLMPLGEMRGLATGMRVKNLGKKMTVPVGTALKGCVLNGMGEFIDGMGGIAFEGEYPVDQDPPDAYRKQRIHEPITTGIRAIDGVLTMGRGQRMGIFSGSGVGKSTLLGMIARHTSSDVNVIALIGERGREVREFIEKDLGPEGLAKSVLIVVTGHESPLLRIRGAYVATAIAEYFRDQGQDVMFMMDSVTRFAVALREVGLTAGEPPTTRGYPPSVFSTLQRLLERTGTGEVGSITALYTVLSEGDDFNEPVSDAVRGVLDGHVVLSRSLANRSYYPAIDILQSISRLTVEVTSREHQHWIAQLRQNLATYRESEDMIELGAYTRGSSPKIDQAIRMIGPIETYLQQAIEEHVDMNSSLRALEGLFPA